MKADPRLVNRSDLDVRVDRHNRRIRFVGPSRPADVDDWLSAASGSLDRAGKIIVYAGDVDRGWSRRGFVPEARIARFFADGRDAVVWSAFLDVRRRENPHAAREDRVVALARGKALDGVAASVPPEFLSRPAEPADADEVSSLLRKTFSEYPDPIDRGTVRRWIANGERYFRVVERRGSIVACASADVDPVNRCAELTDCATLPAMRGMGLMTLILSGLEADCEEAEITDTYTLARAGEVGINVAFARLGYEFTGRLVNNCRMPDGWESMNVWCRNSRR